MSPARAALIAGILLMAPGAVTLLEGCGPRPAVHTAPAAPVASPPSPADPGSSPIPTLRPVTAEEREAYAGSQECVACHQEHAGQLRTHHAQTLAIPSEKHTPPFSKAARIHDPKLGVTYSSEQPGGKPRIRVSESGAVESAPVEYVFGSGNRCFTFVGRYEGQPVEFRISYYRQAGRWDYTPGHEVGKPVTAPLGRILARDRTEACFVCHSTAAVIRDGQPDPDRSILGVTCETCHGPGREHIRAVRAQEKDLRMARLASVRSRVSEELCGQCHRTKASVADPHDPAQAGQLPRFQGAALALSPCFIKSAGKLTCISCHNPHRDAHSIPRVEYNAQCVSCHTPAEPAEVACKTQPRGDCVSCHMPSQKVDMPTGLEFRTHWIKVWKKQ